jgi:hypothetical protein
MRQFFVAVQKWLSDCLLCPDAFKTWDRWMLLMINAVGTSSFNQFFEIIF